MVADRLSGGIAPLVFKIGSRKMLVVRLSALATFLPEKKLDLEAEWVLELLWMWREFSCFCQDLNTRYSSIYPSHCNDCAATY
jgi:hypothetical protein